MRFVLFTIILVLNVSLSQTADADSLSSRRKSIGYDKIQHAAFSCLWTISSQYVLENKSGFGEDKALAYSIGSSLSLGLAKELNDSQTRKIPFDWGDMLANGIGIAIAILIITH